jgi:hypothetical protein
MPQSSSLDSGEYEAVTRNIMFADCQLELSDPSRWQATRCPTTRFDRVLVASPNYCYVAPSPRRAGSVRAPQKDFLFSCFPDSFGARSLVRYCTVTSVPTGISEKNLRAVSSGNRMQPCDAG